MRKSVPAIPFSCPQFWFICAPICMVNSSVLPMRSRGPLLPSVAAGKGIDQVPHLLQVLRAEGRRTSCPHHATTWQITQPGQAHSWSCEQDQVRYTVKSSAGSPECFSWRESVPVLCSVVSEVWGRLCTALSRTWDINTDCFRSMNLSIGHFSSPGPDMTMNWMAIKPTTSVNSSSFFVS